MNFIIAQWVGIITTVVALLSVQFKRVELILIGQIISNLLVALSYWLLGGMSGAWICILAAVQTVIIFFLDKANIQNKSRKKLFLLIFSERIISPKTSVRLFTEKGKDVGNMPAELCNAVAPLYDAGNLVIESASASFVDPISKRSRHAKQAILFVEMHAKLTAQETL